MKEKIAYVLIVLFLAGVLIYSFRTSFLISDYDKEIENAFNIKKNSPQSVFDGYIEPSIPDEELNAKTLLGVDVNKNDLRDDIEIWINRFAKNYNQRMAMRQYSVDLIYLLKASEKDEYATLSHAENLVYTDSLCLSLIFGEDRELIEKKIWSIVLNTKIRKLTYENKKTIIYSRQSTIPEMKLSQPYLACSFNIEDKENLMRLYLKDEK